MRWLLTQRSEIVSSTCPAPHTRHYVEQTFIHHSRLDAMVTKRKGVMRARPSPSFFPIRAIKIRRHLTDGTNGDANSRRQGFLPPMTATGSKVMRSFRSSAHMEFFLGAVRIRNMLKPLSCKPNSLYSVEKFYSRNGMGRNNDFNILITKKLLSWHSWCFCYLVSQNFVLTKKIPLTAVALTLSCIFSKELS